MAACGAAGRGFESLWARIKNDSSYKGKKVARKSLDRKILEGETIELFRAAIKSPYTLDPYERRLINFLKFVNLSPDEFVSLAKLDPSTAEKKVISFISIQKRRVENGDI